MTAKKSKLEIFIKILLMIAVFILINIIVLNVYYKITKENIEKYISSDFNAFIKLDSLLDFYEKMSRQRANKIFLKNPGFNSIYKTVEELKDRRYAKNKPLRALLDIKTNVLIRKNNSMVLLFDLGFKSVFFNAAKFLSKYFKKNELFQIQVVKNKDFTLYKIYFYKNNQALYFSIFENLIFAAFNKEDIDFIYNAKNKKKNIFIDKDYLSVKGKMRKSSLTEVYFNTEKILNFFLKNNSDIPNFFNNISFDGKSSLNFDISNEKFYLNIYSKFPKNENKIINLNAKNPDIFKILPEDVSILKVAGINSFDDYLKSVFPMTVFKNEEEIIKELISFWASDEIGVFMLGALSEPIHFIKIKNKNKLDEALRASGNFSKQQTLIDPKKEIIKRGAINIPGRLYPFLSSYFSERLINYAVINDYLFLSESKYVINDLIKKLDEKKYLKDAVSFKEISSKIRERSDLFIYFDLTKNIPAFLKNQNFISGLVKIYEKGMISIKVDEASIEIEAAGEGINQRKISLFPGYPKKMQYPITSEALCRSIDGTESEKLIYATSDAKLHVTDYTGKELPGFPVKLNGVLRNSPIIEDLNKNGRSEIYFLTENGFFYSISSFGTVIAPELKTDFKNTFNPVLFNEQFLFYAKKERRFYFLSGKRFIQFGFRPESNLFYTPFAAGSLLFINQKNSITCADSMGKEVKGFPVSLDVSGFGTPLVEKIGWNNNDYLFFLSQNGELGAWDMEGRIKDGFPVSQNGVFYNQPKAGVFEPEGAKKIVTLDAEGVLRIIDHKGRIVLEKKFKEAAGKTGKVLLFDLNRDDLSEIFIYDANNLIFAFDSELNILPGFPVIGNTKPVFSDFNSDNEFEMVTFGVDNNLYIYTIPQF